MHIGLFGGTFDPPHVGHLIVAEAARDQYELDQVWWIPARRSPHKPDTGISPARYRLAMTRRATAGHDDFVVSDLELGRPAPSRTVDTVRQVCAEYPNDTFALLIGGDHLEQFTTWVQPKVIAALVPLIVYPRPGTSIGQLPAYLDGRVQYVRAPMLDIAATDIRMRVRCERSIRYLVSESTRVYIREEGLYRDR